MCVQSSFYHQLWNNTWRSEFKQETDSVLLACWSYGQKSQGSWRDRLECTASCTCTMHGKDIKTRYIGSTSILRFGKDWHSIRLDRMQSSFKEHFQLIVFQKLLVWRLEKSCMRKHTCHLDLHQRSHYVTIGQRNWVRKLFNNQKEKLFDKQRFSNQPNQLQIHFVIDQVTR